MIIYGTNSPKLKSSHFPNHQCTNCGREETYLIARSNYFHIFWIPIFPYKKSIQIVCSSCKHVNKPKEVGQEVKALTQQLKSSVKHPWYSYIGLFIILSAIAFFTIQENIQGKQKLEMVSNPVVNDVYQIKEYNANESGTLYSYLKVKNITQDSVYCSPNQYMYGSPSASMDSDDAFIGVSLAYSRVDLMDMAEGKRLTKVIRGYDENSPFNREESYEETEFEDNFE